MSLNDLFNIEKAKDIITRKFNIFGFDKDGYNRDGFDKMGYNHKGFDKDGYDKSGYNKEGFYKLTGLNREGFDKEGYDVNGYDKQGYDKQGYDKNGFNKDGCDSEGFDRTGFNSEGYDRQGFNKRGIDKEGYGRDGFNKDGYDRDGYDKKSFNKQGYDREGFDESGYNRDGYDKDGYDKKGFNSKGYNCDGYHKDDFDSDGYHKLTGYDKDGFDRSGYNINGIDKQGFSMEGYHVITGYNREGYDRDGFDQEGIDKEGYGRDGCHEKTSYNRECYNHEGFGPNGYNKNTNLNRDGFNQLGYDKDGYDAEGYDIRGFNRTTGLTRSGENKNIKLATESFSKGNIIRFERLYTRYIEGKCDEQTELAICYMYGKGTVANNDRAFSLLVDAAYNNQLKALKLLGDCFYVGQVVEQNIRLAQYIYEMEKGKKPATINQYKAMQPIVFKAKNNKQQISFEKEKEHLRSVVNSINYNIRSLKASVEDFSEIPYWMDPDQLDEWSQRRQKNLSINKSLSAYEAMAKRPYYARMDSMVDYSTEVKYIGENNYMDYNNHENDVISVWSDYGRYYRAKNQTLFNVNGYKYIVIMRRRFDIQDGQLIDMFDDYVHGTEAAKAEITDPYLLRLLEEKKGESNITNIIRTIQLNQNDIIDYDFNKDLIVQGCAGSGKTMILLHRLANMKHNKPEYDWDKVKIITPNRQFSLYIDELSKNLNIDAIERLTLGEYYIYIMRKYFETKLERYTRKVETIVKGEKLLVEEADYRKSQGISLSREQRDIKNDEKLDLKIVEYIYSKDFCKGLKDEVDKLKTDNGISMHYGQTMNFFNDALKNTLIKGGINTKKEYSNFNCILFAKVMFLYLYYGPLQRTDNLVCVDEGQDICMIQYELIRKVNGGHTVLNIYGDMEQKLPESSNLNSWARLSKYLSAQVFELKENYRNSEEIIKYYNTKLRMNDKSFGIKTRPVQNVSLGMLITMVKLQLILGNRTAIVCNNDKYKKCGLGDICSIGEINHDKAVLLSIRQAKGLEFDSVFVFDEGLSVSEKYIAYTRALSELYIVS